MIKKAIFIAFVIVAMTASLVFVGMQQQASAFLDESKNSYIILMKDKSNNDIQNQHNSGNNALGQQ